MLRITLHQDGQQYRLVLSGKLHGPWVGETETVWRSVACPGKRIEVDMREVTAVDHSGCKLLAAMHDAGAEFVAQGVAMTALIEEITGRQAFDDAKQLGLRKKRFQR